MKGSVKNVHLIPCIWWCSFRGHGGARAASAGEDCSRGKVITRPERQHGGRLYHIHWRGDWFIRLLDLLWIVIITNSIVIVSIISHKKTRRLQKALSWPTPSSSCAPNTYLMFSSSIDMSNLILIVSSVPALTTHTHTHMLAEFVPLLYYSISEPIFTYIFPVSEFV